MVSKEELRKEKELQQHFDEIGKSSVIVANGLSKINTAARKINQGLKLFLKEMQEV